MTAVHKANIMKLSDGLFLECARRTAREYPEIQYDERIVDAACMHLVMHPERLDVLLLPNLYGDIVSDLCAGLVGGLGVVPAANLGEDGVGVFEAVHGTRARHRRPGQGESHGAAAVGGVDAAAPPRGREGRRASCAALLTSVARRIRPRHAGSRRHRDDHVVCGCDLHASLSIAAERTSRTPVLYSQRLIDELTEAVLAHEEVARYLVGSHGLTSDAARERVIAYLEELQTTQRYELYRALEYPLYPILRKIERIGENVQQRRSTPPRSTASSTPRTIAATSTIWSSRWSWTMRGSGRRSSPPASTCSADRWA